MTASATATRVVIIGATGRMGLSLLRLLPEFPALSLHGAVAAAGDPQLGRDSGELIGASASGVKVSADLPAALRAGALAIDFSTAAAAAAQVQACAAAGVPLLLGTTGLGPEMAAVLEQAARRIPLLVAAHTSQAVTLLLELVGRAAAALGGDFDVQIQEIHHRAKLDSPSGTALALGAAVMEARGPSRPVGYASMRGGDVVGEHLVHFLGPGERLCLSHFATDRTIFARGALRAGCWLAGQPPGAYRMADACREK